MAGTITLGGQTLASHDTASNTITLENVDKLGIGVSPTSALTVKGPMEWKPTVGDAIHLGAINGYANMELSGSVGGIIDFNKGDGTDRQGAIAYNNDINQMDFHVDNAVRMSINSNGYVVKPDHPAFHAHGLKGETALSSGQVFPLEATTYNKGNHYNTSNYRFTAPISGVYCFQYGTYSYTTTQAAIKINGTDWSPAASDTTGLLSIEGERIRSSSISMYLSENDYVSFGMRNGHTGSIYPNHAWFSGFFVG